MTYFIPSFLQKRILRYALSRLELLDTDALDLDKLDIAWGRRSTVELRDIPIHIKKLAALLRLPPSVVVISAQILLLRMTIPSDLYQSGILVEAKGVEARLSADLENHGRGAAFRHKTRRSRDEIGSARSKAAKSKSNQSHVHDPGGTHSPRPSSQETSDDEELSEHLPTTNDLAKSFLQSEPKERRVELEAAIAQSQYMDQSHVSSEDGDETVGLGIGHAISLPGFLSDFLKGVGDRIQLKVQNMVLDLDLKMDLPTEGSTRSDRSEKPDVVTIRLSVEDIALDAVTCLPPINTRHLTIKNVTALLISEASFFANLARSTPPASPETTHASTTEKSGSKTDRPSLSRTGTFSSISPKTAESHGDDGHSLDYSISRRPGQALADSINDGHNEPLTDSAYRYASGNSQCHESAITDSFYSDQGHTQSIPASLADPKILSRSYSRSDTVDYELSLSCDRGVEGSSFVVRSDAAEAPQSDEPAEGFGSEGSSALHANGASSGSLRPPSSSGVGAGSPTSDSSNPASDRSSPSEDLTQSKIFSHEEAESMYMSAISHVSMGKKDQSVSMPGNWGPSDPESEDDGGIASFLEESLTPQHHTNSLVYQDSTKIGHLLEKNHDQPDTQYFGTSGSSEGYRPFELVTNNQTELNSPTGSVHRKKASSQGSQSSSTNLRTSFTMEKRIMTVDIIVLGLPQERSATADSGIETWSSSPATDSETPHTSFTEPSNNASRPMNVHESQQTGHPTTIEVGNIQALGDMALTRMTILIAQQLNAVCKNSPIEDKKIPIRKAPSTNNHLRLRIRQACWKFLDVVKGVTASSSKQHQTIADTFSQDSEVLLKAEVDNVLVVHDDPMSSFIATISMGKLRFGYASENILSFDSGLKMRESTRDILAPVDNDMVLTVERMRDATKVDITTLPLHICLDLRRLDETFSWFGGFSSMLDLGSSMMSTVTVKKTISKSSNPLKPSRGVHFETPEPIRPGHPGLNDVQSKVSIRIGGFVFDLKGSQATLRLESTAMKLVSRMEGLGLVVDRLILSGPYLQHAEAEPSLRMKLGNLRVEYLSTPKEADLDRLLALLSPSKDKYDHDDDILVDTLLRQRRQGGVIRAKVDSLESYISNGADLHCFLALAEDLKKLSTVAKYLPEDDRPGILTLASVRDFKFEAIVNTHFGSASVVFQHVDFAHVTFPSLMALGIKSLHLHRNDIEELIGEALQEDIDEISHLPMIMARFIGNEMEPTAKIKLNNLRVEYHVSTVMAIMGFEEITDGGVIVADMANSVATLLSHDPAKSLPPKLSTQTSARSDTSVSSKALRLDIALRDSVIGLNPRNSPAKGLVVFTNTHFVGVMPREDEAHATLDIKKASIMVIDDIANVVQGNAVSKRPLFDGRRSQVEALSATGYVSVSTISAAKATMEIVKAGDNASNTIDIEIKDKLFVLESCADSTQTFQAVISGLNPPLPPSKELKYRTEVVPVEDMLASFAGEGFAAGEGNGSTEDDLPLELDEGDMVEDEVPQNLEFVSSFYNPDPEAAYEGIADSMLEDNLESLAKPPAVREIGDKNLLESFQDQAQIAPGNLPLEFDDNHFGSTSTVGGTAHRWNTKHNTYGLNDDPRLRASPLKVRVRDVHIIWNLFDGYDWQHTRDVITHAVEEVQNKAAERLARRDKRKSLDPEEEGESVIGDFLFNSIYIGIPANRDPNELARQVNHNLDELASETGSYATSSTSGSPSRQGQTSRPKPSKLRLKRSKHHKMTFELKGISADVVAFPPNSGETQSSIDIRVQDLEIFDHVPTSTWKKFATYMHDAGERESGTSMVHLEILNVKPVPNLAASEIILKATILPLRLHVDQDALDFMTRFFEFKNDSASTQTSQSEPPFIQRVEINSVRVKLDFKPKRVDYAGIRSGHTNEFMNFFILQESDMILRRVIIYGVSGFDKLGKTLNNIWMPDVKRNQLPGVLAGLSPLRSLVNVGGGVRDLVVVPIREYQKDGRVVRSIQKGAAAFAKTTTSELVKLGAKLAIGTQTVLQSAEDLITPPAPTRLERLDISSGWEEGEIEDEEKKQISLYADQPLGLVQGLRGGYASLERDLLTAKDAIVAMPGEILESGTASGAARAVFRNAPTIILRPAMGISKAVGQTLMGATNSLDPGNRRRTEDKYKKY